MKSQMIIQTSPKKNCIPHVYYYAINLMFLLLFSYPLWAQTILQFQPNISPKSHYLGDIVLITEDKNNLSGLSLDSTPKPGQHISAMQIENWITTKKGAVPHLWHGKKNAVVTLHAKTSGTDLLRKAETELKNFLESQHYSRIQLTSKTTVRDSPYPLSAFKVTITNPYPTRKRVCVHLNFNSHTIPVWFAVKAYKKVLVAKHKIKTHTIIQEHDFIREERNIAGLKSSPSQALPNPMWLIQSISTNHILTTEHMTEMPAITKGQKVAVKIKNQGISLTTEAIAQHEGHIGQTIMMKNIHSNKYFPAVVTSCSHAEIVL